MKRLVIALAAVAVLAVGTAAAAFAQAPAPPAQQAWACPGWAAGADGTYDPAANPTLNRMADKLGMSAADLVKRLQGGESVAEVAAAQKVDLQALVDVLQAPQAAMLKVRVDFGYLTQEQADAMKKLMADRIRWQLEQKSPVGAGFGMGPGGFGRGGMMGPGMMGPGMRGGSGGPGMMTPGFGPFRGSTN